MPNLLIVDQDVFNCGWGGSTPRIMDLANGLTAIGWKCSIISGAKTTPSLPKPPEDKFPGPIIRTSFPGLPFPGFIPNRRGLRSVWIRLNLSKYFYYDPENQGWAARLRRNYDLVKLAIPCPDVVWGISYGDLRGIVAARDISRAFSCPLVFEIQDPVPAPNATVTKREFLSLKNCLEASAAIVTTTKTLALHLEEVHECARGKTHAEYLSFDDSDATAYAGTAEPRSFLQLLYAGILSGGTRPDQRNAIALVKGIARAKNLDPGADIRLCLVGPGKGMRQAVSLAGKLGVKGAVVAFPPVDHWKALDYMRQADVLVVIKFQDPAYNMQIPGKIFQCMPFGKPIFGIMGACEAADILRRSGLGVMACHEDTDAIARCLLKFWSKRQRLEEIYTPDKAYIAQFSRSAMALRVNELFRSVMAGRISQSNKDS